MLLKFRFGFENNCDFFTIRWNFLCNFTFDEIKNRFVIMKHMPANNRIGRSISTTVQGMQHWNEITIKSKIQILPTEARVSIKT